MGWRRERLAGLVTLVGVPLVALAWVAHIIPVSVQQKLLAQVRLNDVLSGQVNDANFSTVERLAHWIAGLRMFAAHPLLGVGAGNYSAVYAAYAAAGLAGLARPRAQLLHQRGGGDRHPWPAGPAGRRRRVAGGGLARGPCWHWRRVRMTATRPGFWPRLDPRQALALGLLAALVALTIHNLTDDLFVHAMEQQFALVLGCLLRAAVPFHARR